ncbi:DUF320 domain-containing protein [Actinomadura sp. KC216]|uniref:chaplin family protein n=1 Tax=Actinomadura sp. KC216 TaxID=2530370 RepID=UPI00104D5960|nr:chaplin family protein [Actinomadura sp. KC216]TDB89968.1 DUF320 domain-containing protein [Actinomadura sp. KC216]
MRTWAKGTSRAAVLAAGFVALGVSAIPASASTGITDGSGSVLGGNQINAPISAPADVSGNAVAAIGAASGGSVGGAKVHEHGSGGQATSGTGGIGSGNQANAPISVAPNVCGNAVAVIGHADAACVGGAETGGGTNGQVSDGTGGVLAGNQANAPVSAASSVCGNAAAVAGHALAGCEGGASTGDGGSGGQFTDGAFGVLAGNQVNAPISIVPTICGNAVAVVGHAAAFCEGGAHAGGGSGDQVTSGAGGVLSGNQANAPISLESTVCGNAAAVIGFAAALCDGGPGDDDGYPGGDDGYPHHRMALAGEPFPGASTLPVPSKVDGLNGVAGSASGKREAVKAAELPKVGGAATPKTGGLLKGHGLPKTGGVPQTGRQSPTSTLPKTGALPKTDGLVKGLHAGGASRHLAAAKVPGVPDGHVLPAKPVVPQLKTATKGLPDTGKLGQVEHVAAQETIADGAEAGSMWTLAVAGMLAAVAGALGLGRRVRPARH